MKRPAVGLGLVLAVALLVRLPGVLWGLDVTYGGPFIFYSYDEFSVVEAMIRAVDTMALNGRRDYFYGFVFETIPVLWAMKAAAGPLVLWKALIAVRLTNLVYALGSVVVTYAIARDAFRSWTPPLLAAALLAFFPLHVIHSHNATPLISGLLWSYLSFWATYIFLQSGRRRYWWLACAASGGAIAVKFFFVTWIPLLYAAVRARRTPIPVLWGLPMLVGSFLIFNMGLLPSVQVPSIMTILAPDNFGGRLSDKWTVPVMYLVGLIPGMGLLSFAAALLGRWTLRRGGIDRDRFVCFELPLIVHFVSICFLTASFVRHVALLLPYGAVLAAVGATAAATRLNARSRRWAVAVAVGAATYQALAVGVIERQHVRSQGAEARHWLLTHVADGRTAALGAKELRTYRNILGLPDRLRAPSIDRADFIVLSEGSVLMPFHRSVLNPLTSRPSPRQRYGYAYLENPPLIESIVHGSPGWRRAAFFPVHEVLPEFALHKRLFGTYNWLEGDFSIYERTNRVE